MQNKTLEIWVGIFMLAGVVAIAILGFKVSGSAGAGGDVFRVDAKFENVGGLNEKAPVMVGGVRVGRVAEIRIDKEDYSAIVGMDIDSQYDNLPIDTGASILTAGLLGAQFVGLDPGAEEDFLIQGDQLEITQSAIQLETLISQFMFSQGSNNKDDKDDDDQ